MKNSFALGTAFAALLALPLLIARPAQAGIEACGNIDIDASATCEVKVEDCDITCSPITVEAACAAKLEGSCDAQCPQLPSVSCTADCQGSCEADCDVDPPKFDCSATCKADATAECNAQCASNANQGECKASCEATFSAKCDASCSGKPGSASCQAKCEGRCEGSCTASSKLSCQVDCQGKAYASCKTNVSGGCKGDCSNPRGALFCNGQYIDNNGSVDDCIAALKAALPTIKVDASAQGESSCMGSTCMASGSAKASANCAFSPSNAGGNVAGAFAVVSALGAALMRRRRSR